ncbi:hypothetical protein Barb7_02604 [Bacteroidales bacterium Barb7]|nr:hypothetical protein Barb7_02604 [Bacteroidales bacterium Barb7]
MNVVVVKSAIKIADRHRLRNDYYVVQGVGRAAGFYACVVCQTVLRKFTGIGGKTDGEVAEQVAFKVEASGVALKVGVQDDTVLVVKVTRQKIAGFLIASADGQLMGLCRRRAKGSTLPIRALAQVIKLGLRPSVVLTLIQIGHRVYFLIHLCPFAGIQQV